MIPPSDSIDARIPSNDSGEPTGWSSIELSMCAEADEIVRPEHFDVFSAGTTLFVTDVLITDGMVSLTLSSPIPPGECTIIRHLPTDTDIHLGFLPGDVSGDGLANALDILVLIDYLNGIAALNDWQCDIDRSGECDPLDILRLIDLLNGAGGYDVWLGAEIAPCP